MNDIMRTYSLMVFEEFGPRGEKIDKLQYRDIVSDEEIQFKSRVDNVLTSGEIIAEVDHFDMWLMFSANDSQYCLYFTISDTTLIIGTSKDWVEQELENKTKNYLTDEAYRVTTEKIGE